MHLLIEREIKKMEFKEMIGISNGTLARLGKNEPVSLDVLEKICITLDCEIQDVVVVTKE